MAHLRVMYKAFRLNRIKQIYLQEKINSIKIANNETPNLTLRQKCRHCCIDFTLKCRRCFLPDDCYLYHMIYKFSHTGSIENYLMKSLLGFTGGCLLTYTLFIFFVIQLRFELTNATVMCAILGCILTIGLAFSSKVRCVVFLTLPQFFSKRGRQALLAYALILAVTGPIRNTLTNIEILHESLACETEQVKQVLKQILEIIKKPFYAIRDAIKTVVQKVKVIMKKIKEILLSIKRIVVSILRVIKSAFLFLGKLLNVCNKELGTPFERCAKVFDNAILDCNAKLGPLFSWLCSITYLVKSVCYIVKIFDIICMVVDFINDSIIGVVIKKIKNFIRHVRTMFYVRIKFSHSFQIQSYASKSMSDVKNSIINEIKERTRRIVIVFGYMNCVTSLFFFCIILRVIYYRYRFLTSTRFDNKYITRHFVEIDLRRAQLGRETVLPLNNRERLKYVAVKSTRLATWERKKLMKAIAKLVTAAVKLGSYMLMDYVVYWIATKIKYYGSYGTKVQAPASITLQVEGRAIFADLLRSIVKAFRPSGLPMEVETVSCLPTPLPPDYDRYIEIVTLLIFCTILTVFEPYGLRLRQWVMCYYHPLRSKQRSIWLYNQIIKSRTSFLKLARRKLRRLVKGNQGQATVTLKEYLKYKLSCRCTRFFFNFQDAEACLLCGETYKSDDQRTKLIRCITPGCLGIYCQQCFDDLNNICTVCKSPMEYGDLSDLSEERDSSDDDDGDHQRSVNEQNVYFFSATQNSKTINDKSNDNQNSASYLDQSEFSKQSQTEKQAPNESVITVFQKDKFEIISDQDVSKSKRDVRNIFQDSDQSHLEQHRKSSDHLSPSKFGREKVNLLRTLFERPPRPRESNSKMFSKEQIQQPSTSSYNQDTYEMFRPLFKPGESSRTLPDEEGVGLSISSDNRETEESLRNLFPRSDQSNLRQYGRSNSKLLSKENIYLSTSSYNQDTDEMFQKFFQKSDHQPTLSQRGESSQLLYELLHPETSNYDNRRTVEILSDNSSEIDTEIEIELHELNNKRDKSTSPVQKKSRGTSM